MLSERWRNQVVLRANDALNEYISGVKTVSFLLLEKLRILAARGANCGMSPRASLA
jgi:hypothetical protein